MSDSYLKTLDLGVAALLHTKFQTVLSLSATQAQAIVRAPKPIALRLMAEQRGATEAEFISFWKSSFAMDWERSSTPVSIYGFTTVGESSNTNVKAVPVHLRYSVWFWSKYPDRLNAAGELYLFWQFANPNMTLVYNDDYELEFDLHFGEIEDESTVAEKFERGALFCYRAPLTVDGWVFSESAGAPTIESVVLKSWDNTIIELDLDADFDATTGEYSGDMPRISNRTFTE